jgi:hypothetical protein
VACSNFPIRCFAAPVKDPFRAEQFRFRSVHAELQRSLLRLILCAAPALFVDFLRDEFFSGSIFAGY